MKVLEVRSVSFAYAEAPVLSDISLSVEQGEFVGIIGPNGSGKTTLLRLISRTLRPKSGSIRLKGQSLRSFSARRLAAVIGVVPQESYVAFPFTVFEVVLMGRYPHLRFLGFESEHDVMRALEAMEITETRAFADRYLHELSGGERQRCIIARALAQEPEVLLLDEPTAFLDIKHQLAIYDLLRKLNAERRLTILAVSHDLNLAAQYCDRLVLLSESRIYRDGTPQEVISKEHIERVYGAEVAVNELGGTEVRWVVPVGARLRQLMNKRRHQAT